MPLKMMKQTDEPTTAVSSLACGSRLSSGRRSRRWIPRAEDERRHTSVTTNAAPSTGPRPGSSASADGLGREHRHLPCAKFTGGSH